MNVEKTDFFLRKMLGISGLSSTVFKYHLDAKDSLLYFCVHKLSLETDSYRIVVSCLVNVFTYMLYLGKN